LSIKPPEIGDPLAAPWDTYLAAMKARDLDKLTSLLDPETVWMPPNDTSLFGPEEVGEWWKEYFEYFRVTSITEAERQVTINGELAVQQSNYMIVITPVKGGTRIRDDGRILRIWKRQPDGSWKMWRVMWNSIRPVGSGTNRYMSRLLQKKNRAK
jgi:ketosteroid isomerase-like protein